MNKPFELAEDGKVRIVGVVIRDNAQSETTESALAHRWQLSMTKDLQGRLIASGFKLSQ